MRQAILALLLIFLVMPSVLAEIDFRQELTSKEEKAFDEILKPVLKVYRFIQYAASVLGVLALAGAGLVFATSGGDQGKKERAKQTATGVVIGLILIWVAPIIVSILT